MSSSDKNLSDYSQNSGNLEGAPYRVAIVVADWNKEITEALYVGARETLLKHGVSAHHIRTIRVPGTYELPQAAACLLKESERAEDVYRNNAVALRADMATRAVDANTPLLLDKIVDAVICLGCVIKGETSHNEYINHAVAQALQTLALRYFKPAIFGVLTPNDQQQALDRAGGKHGNKGTEAAITALQMLNIEY
jgi:6,7-dimethyl-8-ribityllumazine synthase